MKQFVNLSLTVALCALWNPDPVLANGYIRVDSVIPTGVGNEVVTEDGTLPDSPSDLLFNKQRLDSTPNPVLVPTSRAITPVRLPEANTTRSKVKPFCVVARRERT